MDNKRRLVITDIQIDNGKKEKMEITTDCTFSGEENDYTIEFDEIFSEDMQSHTTMKVKDGTSVLLLRQGSVNSEMIIEKGTRHNCVYSTPFGDIMMGIRASEVKSKVSERVVFLKMCYKIDYYGNVAQEKEMILKIR